MVDKKKIVYIEESKEIVFDLLESVAPALFGDKVYADAESFSESGDSSCLRITFKDEVA